ncbi:hypothetical protein [Pedobacter deserti]|uniref:hypothetical protein n=1 Tax=Pedobacter deserti TaxID=2817382 RepID=UPI00210DA116|nr:hypothetical protein [Pedobacter sp. SYSU D00382]
MKRSLNEKRTRFGLRIDRVAILMIVLILLCSGIILNLRYLAGFTDLYAPLIPAGNYTPHLSAAAFTIFLFWLTLTEVKKMMVVKILSDEAIEVRTLTNRFVIKRGSPLLKEDALHISKGRDNRVIHVAEGKREFHISQFYLMRYNVLRDFLIRHEFLIPLKPDFD